ncbi:MAG: hypothetical protein IIW54_12975 [Lachnospiraceae bacterium]|nr:hypothetical protein [Lachnospiraceae bacterium]
MNSSFSIIGGADGPTSIFLAGRIGTSWLNIWGLIIVVLLLVPNIIYAVKEKNQENKCSNKYMNILEQIGRYGSMFLMVFNIGLAEFGFSSVKAFIVYMFGNILLMISYWFIWVLYFKKKTYWKQIALALIPTGIFLLSGITMLHFLLIIFAVIFGIGHLYVTNKNRVD